MGYFSKRVGGRYSRREDPSAFKKGAMTGLQQLEKNFTRKDSKTSRKRAITRIEVYPTIHNLQ